VLNQVVIATGNPGKLKEFGALLGGNDCRVYAQAEFDIVEAEETGLSFIENAIIKARNAAGQAAMPAIADDSGLAVDALNGEPGIYSARYSVDDARFNRSGESVDAANNRKLLAKLEGLDSAQRGAGFICALAFVAHALDPVPIVCTAQWRGIILQHAEGSNGFGYDPLFYVPEFSCSSASLDPATKNAHSHRGQAMRALQSELRQQGWLA